MTCLKNKKNKKNRNASNLKKRETKKKGPKKKGRNCAKTNKNLNYDIHMLKSGKPKTG